MRVIDPEGKNLGVISRDEALSLAREAGLDLIEISPNAKPPVARIMSFDKFRYEQEKAAKKERQLQKASGSKRVQISAKAAQNDLLVKVRQLEKFLEEGHPVEIYLRLRGREKRNKEWAAQKLKDFVKLITVEFRVISQPAFGGNGFTMQILSTKKPS